MMRKVVLIILFYTGFAQSFTSRFVVPVYVTMTASAGYDQNFLKFSDDDILDVETDKWLLGEATSLHSSALKESISLLYIPYVITGHETQFQFKVNSASYFASSDKSYWSYFFRFAQHVGAYQWIKLSYNLIPYFYIKEYPDRDIQMYDPEDGRFSPEMAFYAASFAQETIAVTYSHPFPLDQTWLSLNYIFKKQYYNTHFTEFDLDINEFCLGFTSNFISDVKLSGKYYTTIANNITYQNDQPATVSKDRGFSQSKYYLSTSLTRLPLLDAVGIYTSVENREFSSTLDIDPLHNSRKHSDLRIGIWAMKNITPYFSIKLKSNYRKRTTSSDYEFVEGLKSFNKYDIWVTASYKTDINIYH